MKTILLISVLIAVLSFTNPPVDKHKMTVNKQCKELNPITGFMGGCGLYSQLGLEYHSLFLLSFTIPTFSNSNNGKQPVTIGILGMVFITQSINI